ncbi:MAG: AAA family ATPase, partial [Sphingomonadaceae bacterium]
MDELDIVRGLMLRTAGALPATAPLAKALLEWAEPHRPWLLPDIEGEWNWEGLLAGLSAPRGEPVRAEALELAGTLARLLGLSPIDAALLRLMVACDRLPRVGALARLLSRHGHDLPQLLGEMAGAGAEDADRAAR